MKRVDYKNGVATKLLLTAGIIISLVMIIILYMLSKRTDICILTGALICILVSMFLYVLWDMKRSVESLVDNLSQRLDDMVSGRNTVNCLEQSESVQSLLEQKLNQLYYILQKSHESVISEKQELQEIISDISHQVKTPITTIKILSDTLNHLNDDDSQIEVLSEMNTQIEKLEFLLLALVKMSRLENGTFTMKGEKKALYYTIEKSVKGILLSTERKNLHLKVDCASDIFVYHDSKWTAEAIFNLLDNAVKYTPENGSISVVVRKQEMYTQIAVSDTGKGIALENQADIFKRFYRETEVHDIEGVGLGLYLSKKIFELQGGFIDVRSVPGEGAVFEGYLPNYHN